MEPRLLFPARFRYLGYLLVIPAFVLGFMMLVEKYEIKGFEVPMHTPHYVFTGDAATDKAILSAGKEPENFTNELALTLVIVSLILIAFSQLKREDELTAKIRIYALYWAILLNYCLYILVILLATVCTAFNINIGGGILGPFSYLIDFSVYNLFTPLIIFIIIFYYLLFRNKNEFVVKPIGYLPYKPYHVIGKWLSIIALASTFLCRMFDYSGILNAPQYILPIILLMWAYTKEKKEDEYISEIRLEAMQIAVYVNYSLLLIANFAVYGWDFWDVQFINLITIPLIFIVWFQYRLYRLNKQTEANPLAL